FAAQLCDFGAEPGDVLPTLVDRAIAVLVDARRFRAIASRLGIEVPPPSAGQDAFSPTAEALVAVAPQLRLEPAAAAGRVEAGFWGDDWLRRVLYLAQRKDVRLATPRRDELAEAVAAARDDHETAGRLDGLLKVLDDEPLLVLHRATGRGWR